MFCHLGLFQLPDMYVYTTIPSLLKKFPTAFHSNNAIGMYRSYKFAVKTLHICPHEKKYNSPKTYKKVVTSSIEPLDQHILLTVVWIRT